MRRGLLSPKLVWVFLSAALAHSPAVASAYTIKTALTDGCHESITAQALRAVRSDVASAAPLAIDANEQALVDDLQFTPAVDVSDLGGATLLISVRDNDLRGGGANDLSRLASVHGDVGHQSEHCLRDADQKEPNGSAAAVADCRAYIRSHAALALDGLDAAGVPDPTRRMDLAVHLQLRGQMTAPLPTYYVRIGQALHALQDSFTHSYRTVDGAKITVALNYLSLVDGTLDEAHDGPGHAQALDQCDDPDELRKQRRELATEASTALLRATLEPGTRAQKLANVDTVLDRYVSYSPGCNFDNNWCDAPERQYADKAACACSAGPTGGGLGGALAVATLGLSLITRRRATRGRLRHALATAAGLTFVTMGVRAQPNPSTPPTEAPAPEAPETHAPPPPTEAPVEEPDTHAPPPPTVVPVEEPGPADPSQTAFGAYLGSSISIDKPALAEAFGLRLRVSKQWTFGLDGEWNPWLTPNAGPLVHSGVANVYGTAFLRFPLAYEHFNLRTSLSLGASHLLMNLYGAPKGSNGVYVGVTFLGLEWKMSRAFFLILSPLNIALPAPVISNVPLLYPQYRFTVGLEVYAG